MGEYLHYSTAVSEEVVEGTLVDSLNNFWKNKI